MLENHQPVIVALNQILSDTFALYFKTHTYHWNVDGINFKPLHDLFGEQYDEMWKAVDIISERINQKGCKSPFSLKEMLPSVIQDGCYKDATSMIVDLRNDHSNLLNLLHGAVKIAQQCGDEGTADMFIQRIRAHQQHHWFLSKSAPQVDTQIAFIVTDLTGSSQN